MFDVSDGPDRLPPLSPLGVNMTYCLSIRDDAYHDLAAAWGLGRKNLVRPRQRTSAFLLIPVLSSHRV